MKLLSLLAFLSGALTCFFEYFVDRRLVYLFKPLTIVFLISIVWLYGAERKGFYRWAILGGLIFSLVGDVLLIEPQRFVYGLAAFLVAHLFYIAAFLLASGKEKFHPLSISSYLVGLLIYRLISDGVPESLRVAVMVYAAAISTMLGAAFNFYLTRKNAASFFAFSGAAVFVLSDALLAFNKFNGEFALAKLLILSTYFFAQWLIARSAATVSINE